jgi:hypothetical protein
MRWLRGRPTTTEGTAALYAKALLDAVAFFACLHGGAPMGGPLAHSKGGFELIDGLAYDADDDTLYWSSDVRLDVVHFDTVCGGTCVELGDSPIVPKNSSGFADGAVSGVAIGGNVGAI